MLELRLIINFEQKYCCHDNMLCYDEGTVNSENLRHTKKSKTRIYKVYIISSQIFCLVMQIKKNMGMTGIVNLKTKF